MSIIARIADRVKLSTVRSTIVLFDATLPTAAPRTFGRGLLRSLPTYRVNHTASDEAWAAETFNRETTAEDRHFDAMAAESLAQSRLDAGLCC